MQRNHAHEITVARPPAEAIGLFTPRGEEAWVPGWDPAYIDPPTGDTREEMIFTTGHGAEKTFWTCLAWRPEAGHARYLRLTPASRAAFVDVRCRPEGADRTRVRVAYEMRALSESGRAALEDLSETAFAAMIDEWESLIEAHLAAEP